jgi:hypothetical protein
LASEFVNSVNDLGCDVDFIPAGYTCVLQPVDVGVNATFKKSIRDYHHSWCLENYPKILDKDKFPTPERDDVYEWVVNSFDKVSSESIRRHISTLDTLKRMQWTRIRMKRKNKRGFLTMD